MSEFRISHFVGNVYLLEAGIAGVPAKFLLPKERQRSFSENSSNDGFAIRGKKNRSSPFSKFYKQTYNVEKKDWNPKKFTS
ncbi:hypothetical protein A0128_03185 [Leptospira tipperaryensis]|uniref:Uncharacterized protein n=1 Tax=Leptospira tipperaryensis TaxID=2564040 RepID=A0A1D7UTL5_9LEPT|nr:hypothetical protein A0128_03185 [Leptospira tipperaryensis]